MPNTDSLINLKNYPFYQLMPLVSEILLNKSNPDQYSSELLVNSEIQTQSNSISKLTFNNYKVLIFSCRKLNIKAASQDLKTHQGIRDYQPYRILFIDFWGF
jgi:hypothetical protein